MVQRILRDCPLGQLSEEEFFKVFKQFLPFGDPTDYCHYLFRVFDADNSQYIDFKEFVVALSAASRGLMDQKLTWCFKLYDLRREGLVTYQDMLAVVRATYKMVGTMVPLPEDELTPEARVEKLFAYANKDKNKDKLDIDDFKRILKLDPLILNAFNMYDGLV